MGAHWTKAPYFVQFVEEDFLYYGSNRRDAKLIVLGKYFICNCIVFEEIQVSIVQLHM